MYLDRLLRANGGLGCMQRRVKRRGEPSQLASNLLCVLYMVPGGDVASPRETG